MRHPSCLRARVWPGTTAIPAAPWRPDRSPRCTTAVSSSRLTPAAAAPRSSRAIRSTRCPCGRPRRLPTPAQSHSTAAPSLRCRGPPAPHRPCCSAPMKAFSSASMAPTSWPPARWPWRRRPMPSRSPRRPGPRSGRSSSAPPSAWRAPALPRSPAASPGCRATAPRRSPRAARTCAWTTPTWSTARYSARPCSSQRSATTTTRSWPAPTAARAGPRPISAACSAPTTRCSRCCPTTPTRRCSRQRQAGCSPTRRPRGSGRSSPRPPSRAGSAHWRWAAARSSSAPTTGCGRLRSARRPQRRFRWPRA